MKKNWKTVFITGGANGIGFELASMLLGQGANAAIFDLKISDEAKQKLSSINTQASLGFHECDVTDAQGLKQAVVEASEKIGAPDLAINSAGIQVAKTFLELTEEEFTRVVSINLFGSRNFAAAVLPVMKSGGQLAFIASLAGVVTNYTYAAYCSSKFGVVGLAGTLRIECKPMGIAVSVICPPEILTPMVVEELKTMDPITKELKAFADTIPLDSACAEMLEGLAKEKFMIIPGSKARLTWRLTRWLPGVLQWHMDKVVRKMSTTTGS